ncbi:hypothetical protein M409DRAFT_21348 [Zasmidium cellare ATCC 36951]|uniref:Uncharacterized protein n=1 Tax=Zasmidium cellare ATCC 36951 TaxID=1080233 RepID=A0A6A6CRZ8_ZASCE|nr:uncharacterized protein M409DRAFT_21348 [Zasmidium cellare ATCC 36951]KAF2168602.1 hypothetical protein M409DRAFT_21348 [Zasmidium cellare ATCC 36951]
MDIMDSASSPPLKLSAELRNLVYEYALTKTAAVDFTASAPPLTRTCRQLREESLLLYYSLNDFVLRVPRDQCPVYVERFAASHFSATLLGREILATIKHLNVEYHLSSSENQPPPSGGSQPLRRGGWLELAEALVWAGLSKGQVGWTVVSTSFDDPSIGRNYFMYIAESARLRIYQQLVVEDWEKVVDDFHGRFGVAHASSPGQIDSNTMRDA